MRKILAAGITTAVIVLTLVPGKVFAQSPVPENTGEKTGVVVFVRSGCTHCEAEESFLKEQLAIRNDFSVTYYRLENPDDRNIWAKFTERVGSSKVTPITVIGNKYVIGFDKPETTGKELLTLIEQTGKKGTPTDLEQIGKDGGAGAGSTCDGDGLVPCSTKPSYSVTLPFLGKIDTQKYPLFILSALFGFFDGFNPCAMWVLITFLMILLQVGNRRKMVLFAGTFILAEAIMYTLILTAWYKTWDFVRLDTFVTPVVGIVSIVGGVLFLKEWRKKEIECKITDYKQRKEIRDKISFLATKEFTFITFLTILGIAFSVNVIEFACSIGIPQAFTTKILELNRLGFLENASYILTYIAFYMIDDLIVFGIALYGIDKLALTTKYSKLSTWSEASSWSFSASS
jgi:cytochrome c biogenesis protein CcdA/glutaredoxin